MTGYEYAAGRSCLYRFPTISLFLGSLLGKQLRGLLLVDITVWAQDNMVHRLGTQRFACRSGFPWPAIRIAEHLGGQQQSLSNAHISSHVVHTWAFLVHGLPVTSSDDCISKDGWALLPLPCYGAIWSTNMLTTPRTVVQDKVKQYDCESIQVAISGDTSRCKWACHQYQLNGLACSGLLNPPDVVHHWGCRLASLRWRSSDLGCP